MPPAVGLEQDPPAHTPFRRMYAEWLNPRLLRGFHPMIEELTGRYVGEFAEAGGGDFVAAVSARLPVQIIARTLGIDAAAAVAIYEATYRASSAAEPETAAAGAAVLFDLCRAEVTLRRRAPREDVLTSLFDRRVDDRPVSDEALVAWLVGAPLALHELRVLTEVMLRTGEFTPAGEPRFGGPAARGSFLGLHTLPLSMSAFRP